MQFGFWSLVPPILTIVLALLTKNVFVSLVIGILTGSFVLNAFSPLVSINAGIYAIAESMSTGNSLLIASCLIIGAVIHLMEVSGGIDGFIIGSAAYFPCVDGVPRRWIGYAGRADGSQLPDGRADR